MVQVAQRYLDEVQQILRKEVIQQVEDDSGYRTYLADNWMEVIESHWCYPKRYAGLFGYCKPLDSLDFDLPRSARICGCLTQCHRTFAGVHRDFENEGVYARTFKQAEDLHRRIREDKRLHSDSIGIVRDLNAASSDKERFKILLPYGEWQTILRLEFKDVPVDELDLVEVA